jgi:hypothetical protein
MLTQMFRTEKNVILLELHNKNLAIFFFLLLLQCVTSFYIMSSDVMQHFV